MTTSFKIKSAICSLSALFLVGCDSDTSFATESLNDTVPFDQQFVAGDEFIFTADNLEDGETPLLGSITFDGNNSADVNENGINTTFTPILSGEGSFIAEFEGLNELNDFTSDIEDLLEGQGQDGIDFRAILINPNGSAGPPEFTTEQFEQLATLLNGPTTVIPNFITGENEFIIARDVTYNLVSTGTVAERLTGVSSGTYRIDITFSPINFNSVALNLLDPGITGQFFQPVISEEEITIEGFETGTFTASLDTDFIIVP